MGTLWILHNLKLVADAGGPWRACSSPVAFFLEGLCISAMSKRLVADESRTPKAMLEGGGRVTSWMLPEGRLQAPVEARVYDSSHAKRLDWPSWYHDCRSHSAHICPSVSRRCADWPGENGECTMASRFWWNHCFHCLTAWACPQWPSSSLMHLSQQRGSHLSIFHFAFVVCLPVHFPVAAHELDLPPALPPRRTAPSVNWLWAGDRNVSFVLHRLRTMYLSSICAPSPIIRSHCPKSCTRHISKPLSGLKPCPHPKLSRPTPKILQQSTQRPQLCRP